MGFIAIYLSRCCKFMGTLAFVLFMVAMTGRDLLIGPLGRFSNKSCPSQDKCVNDSIYYAFGACDAFKKGKERLSHCLLMAWDCRISEGCL